jgi:hypothetical protein
MQYYMHNFLTSQPDLNLHNPEVQDALLDVVRFWLERGVDGFRLDTINFYFHDLELRDNPALAPEAPQRLDRTGGQPLQLPGTSLRQEPPGKPRLPEALPRRARRVSGDRRRRRSRRQPARSGDRRRIHRPATTRCTCATPSNSWRPIR